MRLGQPLFVVILVSLLLSGCWGWVEYYDVVAEEVKVPEGIGDVIPQEGATLTLDLTYEFVPATKFQPGRDYKHYRYRALIDGWEYCCGAVFSEYQKAVIPIMANDTHSPVSIVVEGSVALDYEETPKEWGEWHELYRGTQECLPAGEPSKYDKLADARLCVVIDGKTYHFDIDNTGSGLVFKRLLAGQVLSVSAEISDSIWPWLEDNGFRRQILDCFPPHYGQFNGKYLAGGVYITSEGSLHICLRDKQAYGYNTCLGTVVKDDLKALKILYPGTEQLNEADLRIFLDYPSGSIFI